MLIMISFMLGWLILRSRFLIVMAVEIILSILEWAREIKRKEIGFTLNRYQVMMMSTWL